MREAANRGGGQAPQYFRTNDFSGYTEAARVTAQGDARCYKRRSGKLGYGKRIIQESWTGAQGRSSPQDEPVRRGKKTVDAPWTDAVSSVFASSQLIEMMDKQRGLGKLEFCQFGTGVSRPLPPAWEAIVAHSGKRYFYNSKTGTSQWEEPDTDVERVAVERPMTAHPRLGGKPRNFRQGAQRKVELARNGGVCALRGVFRGGQPLLPPPYNPWRAQQPVRIGAAELTRIGRQKGRE